MRLLLLLILLAAPVRADYTEMGRAYDASADVVTLWFVRDEQPHGLLVVKQEGVPGEAHFAVGGDQLRAFIRLLLGGTPGEMQSGPSVLRVLESGRLEVTADNRRHAIQLTPEVHKALNRALARLRGKLGKL